MSRDKFAYPMWTVTSYFRRITLWGKFSKKFCIGTVCSKYVNFLFQFITRWVFLLRFSFLTENSSHKSRFFLSLWNWAEYLWLLTLDSVLCNLWLLSFALHRSRILRCQTLCIVRVYFVLTLFIVFSPAKLKSSVLILFAHCLQFSY